jgi:Domain of unknown function (DUF6265)
MRRLVMSLGMGLLCAGPGAAQEAGTLAAVAWMAGAWQGEADGVAMEEHWMAPRGHSIVGMHRDVKGGRTVGFEFMRIEVRDGRLVYLASPGGAPPTPFTAIEVGERRIVFENAAHDFPQRVIYWRDGAALRARIEGTRSGRPAFEEWRWDPAPPPAR